MRELFNRQTYLGGRVGVSELVRRVDRSAILLIVALLMFACSGCVYYNTFYHARKWFNQAESARKREDRDAAKGGEIKLYQDAIKKSSKVISDHQGSGYMDDALHMVGKSYYYLGDFPKAERKFRELLSSFPKSQYADESRFFLGKSRFRLENYLLAKEVLHDFAGKPKGNTYRAEAIYLMGETLLLEFDSTAAVEYYQMYVNDYKTDPKADRIRFKIGEIHFGHGQYGEAVAAFDNAAMLAKDDTTRFAALYQKGRVLYVIDSIQNGLAIFQKLADDIRDSLKIPDNLLRVAEGNFLLGNEREAILLYDDITTRYAKWPQSAEAFYRVGTIVQEQWRDLNLAKDLYDQAAKLSNGGQWSKMALAKSADITRIAKYRVELSDSAKDIADDNRFMLAELYRTTINEPDSALSEYKGLVANFPESELAPKALIAVGWLYEHHYHDTAAARESYKQVIDEYPLSDEYGQAINLLGLHDTEYDSVYADKLYALAEEQYFDRGDSEAAISLFQRLIDQYPDSRLAPRADFAMAKIKLRNFSPEEKLDDSTYVDSTMIHAFRELAEKYGNSPIGAEALRLASGLTISKPKTTPAEPDKPVKDTTTHIDTTVFAMVPDTLSPEQRAEARLREAVDNTPLITDQKTLTKGEFIYPISASGSKIEGKVMLRIKLEFDGRVSDVEFIKKTGNVDIDREIRKAMLETYFVPNDFDPTKFPGYFLYNYEFRLPEMYK